MFVRPIKSDLHIHLSNSITEREKQVSSVKRCIELWVWTEIFEGDEITEIWFCSTHALRKSKILFEIRRRSMSVMEAVSCGVFGSFNFSMLCDCVAESLN